MTTKAARKQKAYRDRERVKRLRNQALFDQVLAAMEVGEVRTADGRTVNISLSKTCPEYAVFEALACDRALTPTQLFGQLVRGATRRYLAGEV